MNAKILLAYTWGKQTGKYFGKSDLEGRCNILFVLDSGRIGKDWDFAALNTCASTSFSVSKIGCCHKYNSV